jgi:hypothetical protein
LTCGNSREMWGPAVMFVDVLQVHSQVKYKDPAFLHSDLVPVSQVIRCQNTHSFQHLSASMRFNLSTQAFLGMALASTSFAAPKASPSLQKRSAKYAIFHDLAAIVGDQRFRSAAFDNNQMSPGDNVIVVYNSENVPMHLFVENDNTRLSDKLISLPAGQFFMLYDMPNVDGVNGAIQALIGCDKKGNHCASPDDGSLSKFEWTAGSNNNHDT